MQGAGASSGLVRAAELEREGAEQKTPPAMNMPPAACLEKENFEEMLRDLSQDMNLLGPAQMGMLEAVKRLLARGADIHARSCSSLPLQVFRGPCRWLASDGIEEGQHECVQP